MARTKLSDVVAALQAELTNLRAERDAALEREAALSRRIDDLSTVIEHQKKELALYQMVERPSRSAPTPTVPASTNVLPFRERCAMAKALAMKSGRAVKIA
jgi:hypothetical protein